MQPLRTLSLIVIALGCSGSWAQSPSASLPPVTISEKALRDPVEKSYRRMVRGMELYEQSRALAPDAPLRFRLLPRHRDTDMRNIRLDVVGRNTEFRVPIAPDDTFVLPRDPQALADDAVVMPNRRARSMTWRTEIRTPGLPPPTRRLGDMRLECEVGMEAGLISNHRGLFDRLLGALSDTPAYCHRADPQYLFFSEQPLFSVTLVSGPRRRVLPIDQLYAGASDDPRINEDLPYCDCEVLLDRSYYLPLGDRSWPDDTLVEFEPMAGGGDSSEAREVVRGIVPGRSTRADVAFVLPAATVIRFDSGYEVWVDRDRRDRRTPPETELAERIVLVDATGLVTKVRVRPAWIPARGPG